MSSSKAYQREEERISHACGITHCSVKMAYAILAALVLWLLKSVDLQQRLTHSVICCAGLSIITL